MSDISKNNLDRLQVGHYADNDSRFCLSQVIAYEAEDNASRQKIEALLEGRVVKESPTMIKRACNIGGCTLKITDDLEVGRETTGQCKAASYCLKTAFEAIAQAPKGAGGALYKEIIDNLERHSDKYSAGNFCPKLDCDLSAGVSIDMVPGTAGECVVEKTKDQLRLDF